MGKTLMWILSAVVLAMLAWNVLQATGTVGTMGSSNEQWVCAQLECDKANDCAGLGQPELHALRRGSKPEVVCSVTNAQGRSS